MKKDIKKRAPLASQKFAPNKELTKPISDEEILKKLNEAGVAIEDNAQIIQTLRQCKLIYGNSDNPLNKVTVHNEVVNALLQRINSIISARGDSLANKIENAYKAQNTISDPTFGAGGLREVRARVSFRVMGR